MAARLFAIALAGAALASCAASSVHRLPLEVSAARATFAPLSACAKGKGMEVSSHPDSVNVKIDATTWVQFMAQEPNFNMVIIVDEKAVPPAQMNAKLNRAKATGDELFACAAAHPG